MKRFVRSPANPYANSFGFLGSTFVKPGFAAEAIGIRSGTPAFSSFEAAPLALMASQTSKQTTKGQAFHWAYRKQTLSREAGAAACLKLQTSWQLNTVAFLK